MGWLQSCCRCCSLKTGTVVSGVTGILLSVAAIIIMFTTSVEFKTIVIDWLPSAIESIMRVDVLRHISPNDGPCMMQWIRDIGQRVKIILTINLAMTVLISTLLIIGALKRNTFLMLPWVVLGLMLAVGLLVSIIYTATVFYIGKDVFNGTLWLVFGIVSIVIYVYMWLVVFSYFQELRDDENRGRYAKAPYQR